ncbi:hypothetical protein JNB62_17710 [Microbacterium jejuense]|uniref:Uncharacterized protein n=1 Tax=Microbacterium jejuense TaxID=1263637 RepID=A0ABS7HSV8_9MICO|nr:hypothetical protein [Microbacterium jejuense]MBW9095520.1 hypothetical protein [Microbacterium jejuense]
MSDGRAESAPPRLTFQLPGRWLTVDPRDARRARADVETTVRDLVGAADDAAIARRRLRSAFDRAIAAAAAADAHALFLCLEAAPGVWTPASLTVHAPKRLRMTPAVGRSADAVLAVLREGLALSAVDGAGTARRLDGPRVSVLRTERAYEETVEEDGVRATATRLEADYWFAVPGSKHVVLASFVTPLGELRNAMLSFFDSIALAASFGGPAARA